MRNYILLNTTSLYFKFVETSFETRDSEHKCIGTTKTSQRNTILFDLQSLNNLKYRVFTGSGEGSGNCFGLLKITT